MSNDAAKLRVRAMLWAHAYSNPALTARLASEDGAREAIATLDEALAAEYQRGKQEGLELAGFQADCHCDNCERIRRRIAALATQPEPTCRVCRAPATTFTETMTQVCEPCRERVFESTPDDDVSPI